MDNEARFNVILKTLDASESIHKQLINVEQLNSAINDHCLVSLLEHSNGLNSCLKSINFRAQEYKELLEQCPNLEDIVNLIPRLDECIHNSERFDEAIDLLEWIENLHRKYGRQVSILNVIYKQSEIQRDYLVSNLCERLEHFKDSSNDEVITIVNYLARCGNYTDRDLRLKYLQARDTWFNNTCEEQSSSFDYVALVFCNGLPMIFKEYKSIFGNSNAITTQKLMKLSSSDQSKEDGAIINSWLLLKTSIFIASLEIYLQTMAQSGSQTPTVIGDTMQKCNELTDWLASIGFDFSSQLRPLFAKALIDGVTTSIDRATSSFESVFASTVSKSVESLLLPVDDEILRISNMRPGEQIPKSIEYYPIFRIYCLYIIDSLRWLQITKHTLSPISLCIDTYSVLNASLTRVMKALEIILNMDNNHSHPILSKIAISFITEVLPFFVNYCERLFPEKIILSAIGLSKSEFKTLYNNEPDKLSNLRLDLRQIAHPLKSTMPALVQTIEN